MPPLPAQIVALLLLLGFSAGARAQLDFDLVEVTGTPGPDHPGIDFVFEGTWSFETEAGGVAVADFDADGRLDILLPNTEGHAHHLYLNQGDGSFVEAAAAHGLDEPGKRRSMAAAFDYDRDGDIDLLTVGHPGHGPTTSDLFTLFRNDGPPAHLFTDVTTSAGGFSFAATVESSNVGDAGGLAVADVDADGWLDVLVTWWENHHAILQPNPGFITNTHDQPRLFLNRPNPTPPGPGQPDHSPRVFVDASIAAGLDTVMQGIHWMPALVDVNRDGRPDLYLCMEGGPDVLRLNSDPDGPGPATVAFGPDIATSLGLNTNGPGWGNEMGAAWEDLDHDQDLDLLLTNAGQFPERRDKLYRNDSQLIIGDAGLAFADVSVAAGIDQALQPGWGVLAADLDNDGDLDLVTARGLTFPYPNTLHENLWPATSPDGITPLFVDRSAQVPGFSKVGSPLQDILRGLVAFDIDLDGDLDLLGTRTGRYPGGPPLSGVLHTGLFLNTLDPDGGDHHWVQLDLRETGGRPDAVGARVHLRTGGPTGTVQTRVVRLGSSFLSAGPQRLHFGLGADSADWIVVRWADGSHTVVAQDVPFDELATLAHEGVDATGDLDGNGVTDCADAALLEQALSDWTVVAAALPDWPWRLLADIDGNGELDPRDLGLLGLLLDTPWCPLPGGVAGSFGEPLLTASGDLLPGAPMAVHFSNALPFRPSWLLLGFSAVNQPLNGGKLVPSPDLIVAPLTTDASGEILLAGPWPAGVPSGLPLYLQQWVQDPAAPWGYAASDGLHATTP